MLLLVDNVDSFTYNLVHLLQVVGSEVRVIRNDALSVLDCLDLQPSHIVIGPGPGTPAQAGISKELTALAIERRIPLLGICLGHQCLGEVCGAQIIKAAKPIHGKVHPVSHNQTGLFAALPPTLLCTRYHSLLLNPNTVRAPLQVDAWTAAGEVMAISHTQAPAFGIQFHPEAVLSEGGDELFRRFIQLPSFS